MLQLYVKVLADLIDSRGIKLAPCELNGERLDQQLCFGLLLKDSMRIRAGGVTAITSLLIKRGLVHVALSPFSS